MKSTIEKYRGFEIWFDTEIESFQCDIDDERSVKKSYASIKKFIDDYIKENNTFKAFNVEPNPLNPFGGKTGKIIGIRKDGNFIHEDLNGKKTQISKYDLDRYIILDSSNKPIWEKYNAFKEEDERIRIERNALRKEIELQFKIITLKDYKNQI